MGKVPASALFWSGCRPWQGQSSCPLSCRIWVCSCLLALQLRPPTKTPAMVCLCGDALDCAVEGNGQVLVSSPASLLKQYAFQPHCKSKTPAVGVHPQQGGAGAGTSGGRERERRCCWRRKVYPHHVHAEVQATQSQRCGVKICVAIVPIAKTNLRLGVW